MVALWGEVESPSVDLLYRVDDLDAALVRIRASGGQAEEPTQERFGRVANCADDQGARFQLWEP
jgi:predicted enzyme related to lactoylglutathione lyase